MSLPTIPQSLIEKLKKGNLVCFVGAGLSTNAGLPNWEQLTITILEGLKDRESKAEGFIEALKQKLFEPIEVLAKIEYLKTFAIEIFEKELRKFNHVEPSVQHSKIASIASKIVTTNYDELLEKSNPTYEKIPYNNTYKLSKISEYEKTIFKIHGDINEPDKCILFPKEYDNLYSHDEKSSIFELKKILSDKSILFLGFSLSDPYINYTINYVSKLYSGFTPEHYIVTTDKSRQWPERISPIILDSHAQLDNLLDKLIEIKDKDDNPKNLQKAINNAENISIKYTSELEYDIPPNIKYWVGRKREIENISNENFKVIFITGIGGQGKSALAAHFVKNNFKQDIYEFGDWRDFKEESNRLQTKIISIIGRLTKGSIDAKKLEGGDTNELIDSFFNYLGERRIIFVFDNVDSYIDLEHFTPAGGIGYLFNQALNRPHNSRFVFTCRPFIREASINFYQISLAGLSYNESLELFAHYNIPFSATQLEAFSQKAHTATKGHPLWLNLIAAQAIRGLDTVNNFIDGLENKTDFKEEDFSSILSEKILTQVWNSLNDKQQSLLRSIAETVKPETITNLKQILSSVFNNIQFDKAFRTLRNLNLIETKSSSITEDQIELHPLVKEFILTKYPRKERMKYITLLVKYYDRYIYILKHKLSSSLPLSSFQNWTSKIELEINKGDYSVALVALEEVSSAIIAAGFSEEYIRVSEKLYDSIDLKMAIEKEFPYFHNQFKVLINTLTHFGKFQKAQILLDKYEKLIPGKSIYYLNYCSAVCYLNWYQEHFETAIYFGEQGEFLLSSSGLQDIHSTRHNLALARRDSKDPVKIEQAMKFFLGVENLKTVADSNEINFNLNCSIYGNIGRCLEFKGCLEEALNCYMKSFKLLCEEDADDTKLNMGYATFWISEVMLKTNKIQEALFFLKFSILTWEIASPPKATNLKTRWENIICDLETKNQIGGKADWQVEKFCKQKLEEYFTDNLVS